MSPRERAELEAKEEWNEEWTFADELEFRQILARVQPKFVPASEVVADKEFNDRVLEILKSKPTRHLNGLLVSEIDQSRGGPSADEAASNMGAAFPRGHHYGARCPKPTLAMNFPDYEACPLPAAYVKAHMHKGNTGYGIATVPRLIVVSGHANSGGNLSINGIYERFPDDFHNRPVYRKTLEKRAIEDIELPADVQTTGSFRNHSPRTRTVMRRYQVYDYTSYPRPPRDTAAAKLVAPFGDFYLYFDDKIGSWCIGPVRGGSEIFAKYPGAQEIIPDGLADHWEVYDVGRKRFRPSKYLKTRKGGR